MDHETRQQKRSEAMERLEKISEKWQEDSAEGQLVRSMIASMRMLLEGAFASHDENEKINPLVTTIFVQAFKDVLMCIRSLEVITQLKGR